MSFQLNLNQEKVEMASPATPMVVAPGDSLRDVLHILKEHVRGNVLVCDDGVLVGIFTERDALRLMAEGADLDAPIKDFMVADPVTLSSGDTVGKAIEMMAGGGYRRLPIVDPDNKPVGVIKVSGILHYLVEHFPNIVYTLPPSPHHKTQQREGA